MDKESIRWLWKQAETEHALFYLLIGADVVISVLGVVFALLVKQLIDAAVSGNALTGYAVWLVLTVVIQYVLNALQLYLSESAGTRLTNHLRFGIIHSLIYADYSETMNHHTGEWMNHLFSDVRIAAEGFVGILPETAGMLARLLFACIALLFLEPLFFIAYFILGFVLIIGISILRRWVKALHRDVQKKEDLLHSFLQELLENILIIKSFQAFGYMESKTGDHLDEHRQARLKKRRISVLANASFALMFRLGYVLALIWGGYGLYKGSVTYGSLMAILQLVLQIRMPVTRLSGMMTRVYEVIASSERIQAIFNLDGTGYAAVSAKDFSKIVFQDVSFRYDRDHVLNHVNLEIHKGDRIALIGTSGGGKSTLFLLMMGLLEPDQGNIELRDEKGGLIRNGNTGIFAYVPQGNAVISGSIADNIAFGKPYSEDKMKKALYYACADEFTEKLPEGIYTELKERGSGLSEGQRQRLAVARAVYSEAPVLLLDEATSALDENTEAELLGRLSRIENRTFIIVTHRKAALSVCDKICELTDGRIQTPEI